MDIAEIKELIKVLEGSRLSELEIEEDGKRIRLSKGSASAPVNMMYAPPMPMQMPGQPGAQSMAPYPAASAPEAETPASTVDDGLKTIDSPMVGTLYLSPAPGDPPFVSVGDSVEEGQTVCIIEAMKIMNEVTAKHAGVVEKVLAENAEPVEFGQAIYAIRPAD